MNIFSSFFNLLFPDLCKSCNLPISRKEKTICASCRHKLPQTDFHLYKNNEIEKIFYGRSKIEFASSFLYFYKNGLTQNLIHNLKYKGHQDIGSMLGFWYGNILKRETALEFDYIVAVPLHRHKEKIRGYNQVDTFGKSLAKVFDAEYSKENLVRIYMNETQTKKSRFARWLNVKEIFDLVDAKLFENKKILLVDDVVTTGATLDACCSVLSKSFGIKISIVTMAVSN
jgi:ComF family protein